MRYPPLSTLKKTDSPSPDSYQLSIALLVGVGPNLSLPCACWYTDWLTFCRCVRVTTAAMRSWVRQSCLAWNKLLCLKCFLISVPSSLSTAFPELWGKITWCWCPIYDLYALNFDQEWVCTDCCPLYEEASLMSPGCSTNLQAQIDTFRSQLYTMPTYLSSCSRLSPRTHILL